MVARGGFAPLESDPPFPSSISPPAPQRGARGTFTTNPLQELLTNPFPDPLAIEGIGPFLEDAFQRTLPNDAGYAPRISVICENTTELLHEMAHRDWTTIIADPRVEWFVGAEAPTEFETALRSRLDCALPSRILTSGRAQNELSPAESALRSALAAQQREAAKLKARVAALYPAGDRAAITKRWSEITAGDRAPTFLLAGTRFSTFTRHACADLAAAFTRRGLRAEVLLEPDHFSRFSIIAYLRRFVELRPDAILLINYPRGSMGHEIPAGIPCICWIQDAMPHLFDPAVGRAQTDLDFLIGNLYAELFEKWEYPKQRLLPIGVVADAEKFQPTGYHHAPRGVSIAYISHQSETPEAMHARLVRQTAYAPPIQQAFKSLWPRLQQTANNAMNVAPISWVGVLTREELARALGHQPDERTMTLVQRTYAMPIVDRLLRHEMLAWAAEIAEQNGYRLALYGKGWETHPTLAKHAAGQIEHGERLRDIYESATVSLHCSATAVVHQRVLECFLSGGLCFCRVTRDAASGPRTRLMLTLLDRPPDAIDDANARIGYDVSRHEEAKHFRTLMNQIGIHEDNQTIWIARAKHDALRSLRGIMAHDHDADWAFGGLADIAFSSREGLESRIIHAAESREWRKEISDRARAKIAQHLTHDALANRLLDLMTAELSRANGVPA